MPSFVEFSVMAKATKLKRIVVKKRVHPGENALCKKRPLNKGAYTKIDR